MSVHRCVQFYKLGNHACNSIIAQGVENITKRKRGDEKMKWFKDDKDLPLALIGFVVANIALAVSLYRLFH